MPKNYNVVCGQGRAEAFIELEQRHIPAMVIQADRNTCLVMGLVENCARRYHHGIELLREIPNLRLRGYSDRQIADKIGTTPEYVNMIANLLEKGEERLLAAVEAGMLPLTLATEIARADEEGAQAALMEAYTLKKLRGKRFVAAKRLLDLRSRKGGHIAGTAVGTLPPARPDRAKRPLTGEAIMRAYQQEAARQKILLKKSEVTQSKLLFIVEAIRSLLLDEKFLALLQAEGLDKIPSQLKLRLGQGDCDG